MDVGFYLADQNPHRDRTIGITVYTENLLAEFAKRSEISITAIVSASSLRSASAQKSKHLPLRSDHSVGRLIVDQLHPLWGRADADVWHYPKGFLPFLFQPKTPVVGTICDVIVQFYADCYPRARSAAAYAYWVRMLQHSIPRFKSILTISNFSKNQILQFCDRYNLRCPTITVTSLAPRWRYDDTAAGLKQNYVLHLASEEPHKQSVTLLRFWKALQTKRRDLPQLCLVGPLSREGKNLGASLNGVQYFSRLSQSDLKTKMANARALIVPSEIEGFGLPAVEAYEMRTPVVFAARAVKECLAPMSIGEFDLSSLESFEVALNSMLGLTRDEIEAVALNLRRRFSWSRCADETIAVYREVLN